MQLEEDEQRVKFDKDRLALIQTTNQQLSVELAQLQEESKRLGKENKALAKEGYEMKEQLRVLNENLRRESESGASREKEAIVVKNENMMLK